MQNFIIHLSIYTIVLRVVGDDRGAAADTITTEEEEEGS